MQVLFSNMFNNISPYKQSLTVQPNKARFNTGVTSDTFIKTSPSFGSTSNGRFLKDLEGIRDPYSGVTILTNKQMNKISKDLSKKKNISQKNRYLAQYTDSMLPVERQVYQLFTVEGKRNKSTNYSEILNNYKGYALNNLIKEQNKVFKQIDEAAKHVKSPEIKAEIYKETNEAKWRVQLPDDDRHRFKRKSFINRLVLIHEDDVMEKINNNIQSLPTTSREKALKEYNDTARIVRNNPYDTNINGQTPLDRVKALQEKYAPETLDEKSEIEPILDIAIKLPTSKNSINAFIVKYHDRSEKEIGERLLNQSVGNIEHIHANSLGGENEAANFMFTTTALNSERGNMPIQSFMKLHPNIPKHCQEYTDDIINAGNKGRLKDHEWYPYLFKDTLEEESGIVVDISKYKIPPEKAFKTLPPRLRLTYPKYIKYIPAPTEPINNL